MSNRAPSPSSGFPDPSGIGTRRIAGIYAVIAALWIAFSDRIVVALSSDPATIALLSTAKGWAFVAISSVLLWGLLLGSQRRMKRLEAARSAAVNRLRGNEALLRSYFDEAPVAVFVADECFRIADCNPAASTLTGFTPSELRGQLVEDLHPASERAAAMAAIAKLGSEARVQLEIGLRHKAGHSVLVLLRAARLANGRTIGFCHDITDRRLAEEILHESEARLRLLGDNLPDSYVYQYTLEADGRARFLYLSAGVEKQHLVKPAEVIADASLLFRQVDPGHLLVRERQEQESRENLTDFDQKLRITRPDGRQEWLHVRARPRRRPDGQVVWDGVATNITEHVQIQEMLRQQKAELTAALASMRDAVFITDTQGRLIEFNEAFATFYRFPNKAACPRVVTEYRAFLELYQPDGTITPFTDWAVPRALRGETAVNAEMLLRRKDTGDTWVGSYSFAPIRDEAGQIVGSVITARDVTGIARARQELQASEDRLRALVTLLPDALFINAGNRLVFVNQRAQQLWRAARPEDLLHISPLDLFHPEERVTITERIGRLRANGGVAAPWETRLVALDGTVIPVETTATTIPYGGERAIQVVVRDISERRQNEQKLQSSRTLLEEMGRSAKVGGWTWDLVTGKGAWSDELAHILDLDSTEPLGTERGLEFCAEEARPRIRAAIDRSIAEGKPYDLEFELVTAKGVRKWVRSIGHATMENGRVVQLHGALQDISDRKKLEAQFLRAQRLEAVGTLASGVAHDLNNILAPVLMTTGLVRRKLTDPHDQHLMELVEASAKRGAAIIRQLLTFSRGVEGARACVQLRHLIRDMEQIMEETFPRNIAIRQAARPDLWTVTADPTQMHQVLMNLCVNARDAMPAGGQLTLQAMNREITDSRGPFDTALRPGRYVVVSVTDTGTGIPPEMLPKIFDPFFTTKSPDQGTGLGLSTVMGIVKNHGGYVTVSSQVGQGSTFYVYLPATDEIPEALAALAAEAPSAGRGELILVVDDEHSVLDATSQILLSQGYPVLRASDGRAAVELFLQHQDIVRLVVTDLMMPVMGGAALIRALRTIRPELRIVAATGQHHDDRIAELSELGVQAVLNKPYTSDDLLRVVRQALDA